MVLIDKYKAVGKGIIMEKTKVLKILLVCLSVLAIVMLIALIIKINANKGTGATSVEAPVEAPIEDTAIATQPPSEEAVTPTQEEATPTQEPTSTPKPTMTPAPVGDGSFTQVDDNIFVSGLTVRLRSEPSADSEIIAEVKMSTLLKRTGIAEEWSRVVYNSQVCYVTNEFVSEQIPEAALSGEDESSSAQATSGGKVVIIDPGHQGQGDSTPEPIGPGSGITKARVTSGTSGSVSGWAEYQLNLAVSLQLRDELVQRGYTVHMTRETHEVSISNKERAEFATANGGDILVRIHANGSEDSSVNGALCMAPTNANSFLSANLVGESQRLSRCVVNAYVAETGFGDKGVYLTDEMSGINWSTMPVTIVEMGYMSNPSDDAKMADSAMQVKMVKGMCDGIDRYFSGNAS